MKNSLSKTKVVSLLVVMLVFAMAGPASATLHEVEIGNFYFSPTKTIVSPGDTVRWTEASGVHTTTTDPSSPKQWDSGILPIDSSFEVIFLAEDGPGPFPYHCGVHPTTMKDTIFVASGSCDCEPGNANGDAMTNIFDITYVISFLYKGGPEPTPYPICSGDPNGLGCTCNIFDATYLISFLYKGGPAPVTCQEWLSPCGPLLN